MKSLLEEVIKLVDNLHDEIAHNAQGDNGGDVQDRRAICANKLDALLARRGYRKSKVIKRKKLRRVGKCPDCGELGALKGHMTCQYPQD